MDKEKLVERLMETFLGEVEEHTRAFNRDLLVLEEEVESEARKALIKTLFRTAHSLKGAARSVGIEPLEAVCHRLEGIFADVRDDRLTLRPELFQLVFAAVDGIQEAAAWLREGRDLSDAPVLRLLARLEAVRRETSVPRPAPGEPAVAPERAVGAAVHDTRVAEVSANPVVRIAATKLDALLACSGELLVARRRLQPRAEEIGALLQFLGHWREEWRKAERPLRRACIDGTRNDSGQQTVPVKAARALDQIAENIERAQKSLDAILSSLVSDDQALERAAAPLEVEIRGARMVPFAQACEGLDRAARDVAKAAGKEVDLLVEGSNIELDRSVVTALRDPLLHLVRNAVDHGIETPVERAAADKPNRGRVTLGAALQGERVRITVTDDGRGLDLDAIREAAARRKVPFGGAGEEATQIIFLPGFSTTHFITEVSGRGVGLDVVKTQVDALHGSVNCTTERGRGVSVILDVPLTLTTIRAVLVSVAGQVHALPQTHVQGLVRIGASDVHSVEGRDVLTLGETPVPVVFMADVLGAAERPTPLAGGKVPAVLLSVGELRAAFCVDELLAEHDLVVTRLGRRLRRVAHFSGASLLPNGRIALILNIANVLRSALQGTSGRRVADELAIKKAEPKRLLVVDDSVTTRSLVKSILEAAGYDVMAAPDGVAAWQMLQERGADLVVADVEMPRMDGCDLTATIRKSSRFRKLPVVLVTALDSAQHKARGMDAGADAYLVKSAFDQKLLLETIAQLV
jgi:two-component system, chemotaxis family, sensor kinase CheA